MKLSNLLLAALVIAGCKSKSSPDKLAKLAELEDRMCACKEGDTDCAKKVQKELKAMADSSGGQKLSEEEAKRAVDLNTKLAACAARATGAPPPPGTGSDHGSADHAADVKPGELPKECGDWKAMVDKLSACEKMPEAQRRVMKDAYVEASKTWDGLPPDGRTALAQSCKAGADAIFASAKATCGW